MGIELPLTVEMKVVETEPAIKGSTVSNVGKPAKMETGLVVQVPAFINEGDVIRVDTRDRQLHRARRTGRRTELGPHPRRRRARPGWIEVITGSMFSGKSEELIRRVRRAQIARQKVQIFKPRLDDRYARTEIVSPQRHEDRRPRSSRTRSDILPLVDADTEVVGIDEGQFFDARLPGVVRRAGQPGHAGDRGGPRPGLPRAGRSSRCRSCWRSPSTWTRRWRSAWCAATRPTAPSGWSRAQDRVVVGGAGHVRGALPALLRPGRTAREVTTPAVPGSAGGADRDRRLAGRGRGPGPADGPRALGRHRPRLRDDADPRERLRPGLRPQHLAAVHAAAHGLRRRGARGLRRLAGPALPARAGGGGRVPLRHRHRGGGDAGAAGGGAGPGHGRGRRAGSRWWEARTCPAARASTSSRGTGRRWWGGWA